MSCAAEASPSEVPPANATGPIAPVTQPGAQAAATTIPPATQPNPAGQPNPTGQAFQCNGLDRSARVLHGCVHLVGDSPAVFPPPQETFAFHTSYQGQAGDVGRITTIGQEEHVVLLVGSGLEFLRVQLPDSTAVPTQLEPIAALAAEAALDGNACSARDLLIIPTGPTSPEIFVKAEGQVAFAFDATSRSECNP